MPTRRYDIEYRSIASMVRRNSVIHADREALRDGADSWSYAELGEALRRSVAASIASGVQPGDRVGLWAPNSAQWVLAALGVLGAGGILVPLNTRYKGVEAADVLRRSGARALFTVGTFLGTDYLARLADADPDLAADLPTTVLDGGTTAGAPTAGGPSPGVRSWEAYLAAGSSIPDAEVDARIDAVGPDDPSDIMFTSGTTGRSKGVVLTHGASLRAHGGLAEVSGMVAGDRILVIPPFFHTFGYKAGWMAGLVHGATVIPVAVFDAGTVLRQVAAERVTIMHGPPTLFRDLIDHPDRHDHDLSSLRSTIPSAAIVPVELVRELFDVLGLATVLTAYGFTECTSLATTCRAGDSAEDIAGSVGRPADDIEVAVIGADGRAVPAGHAGEIVVRGYNVMLGYWEDPEATAAAIDGDGWVHSGDVGVMDERGFLRITDRIKDMVIVGGFNVYPAEVEQVLGAHPAVADAAVVGRPDGRMGEVTVAFVVRRPDSLASAADLITWLGARLANFKVPREVHFVDELPRNASMKVLKRDLRERLAAG